MGRRHSHAQISSLLFSIFAFVIGAAIVVLVIGFTTSRNHNLPVAGVDQKGGGPLALETMGQALTVLEQQQQQQQQQQQTTCDDFRLVGLVCDPVKMPCPAAFAAGCQAYTGRGITVTYSMCLNETQQFHYEYMCDRCAARIPPQYTDLVHPFCITDWHKAAPPNVLCLYVCGTSLPSV